MKHSSALNTVAVGLSILAGIAIVSHAGPLNPPAGPIASTNKTLQEVEPRIAINATNTAGDADSVFKITQPGSYYLTGNVGGVAGKHGIEIVASGVTLDLNGFSLVGVPGSLDGVTVSTAGLNNIGVVNGSLRAWGQSGVDLGSYQARTCRVSNVLADGNGLYGIRANASTITNCSASSNVDHGIVGEISTISHCVAYLNGGNGMQIGSSMITDCSAVANTGVGFAVDGGNITTCYARSNWGGGILAVDGCAVTGCNAAGNISSGIYTVNGCTVTGCTAYGNTTTGITVSNNCTVTGCTANGNTTTGIAVASNCTVIGCGASSNGNHGISTTADSLISGNTCNNNGTAVTTGAGVHASGANNRIEGNNCSNNDTGIGCGAGGNLIIRNSASSNTTNFLFVANNRYGPIVDITGASAAVAGNTAASTMTTTDPHANFRF